MAQLVERQTGDQTIASSKSHSWRSHSFVFVSKTLYPLLSSGSTQEDLSHMPEKSVDFVCLI